MTLSFWGNVRLLNICEVGIRYSTIHCASCKLACSSNSPLYRHLRVPVTAQTGSQDDSMFVFFLVALPIAKQWNNCATGRQCEVRILMSPVDHASSLGSLMLRCSVRKFFLKKQTNQPKKKQCSTFFLQNLVLAQFMGKWVWMGLCWAKTTLCGGNTFIYFCRIMRGNRFTCLLINYN